MTPFPYYSQFGLPQSTPEQQLVDMSLAQLRLVLQQQSAPSDTAAIILEPVMGEGGYVPAPAAYLHGLREICDEHNILLIADEVQSGFGRTGTFWAVQDSGVRPDILVFAKGVANGFPLSGIASRKELMDMQKPGSMVRTCFKSAWVQMHVTNLTFSHSPSPHRAVPTPATPSPAPPRAP